MVFNYVILMIIIFRIPAVNFPNELARGPDQPLRRVLRLTGVDACPARQALNKNSS